MEGVQSWDGRPKIPAPQPKKDETRIGIEDAIAAFVATRINRGVAAGTLKKYRTFTIQLRAYGESRGYVMLDKLDVSDMDRFYALWKDEKR